jgi:hypothetical protein
MRGRFAFKGLSLLVGLSIAALLAPVFAVGVDQETSPGFVTKHGLSVDIRSMGRMIAEEVAQAGAAVLGSEVSPVPGIFVVPQVQLRGDNIQSNDPALDNIQQFPGSRPFVAYTQSETSIAAFGRNIIATYNSSANQPLVMGSGGLTFTRRFLSGYSVSNDGGQTWQSGFMPPVAGSVYTFGDPVAAVDRNGTFYFAGLGADALGRSTINVNRSTNGGRSWSDAVIVQQDNGGDKEWLAVGPDPAVGSRDNVYVTWTSFQASGAQLRFGRSTDGGATFTAKTIFAPAANVNPTRPQNSLQYSNGVVDQITGAIYIPFLHFSNADQDFIRILVSYDAGETFSFLSFDSLGDVGDPTLLPATQAGHLIDCGSSGGLRLSIHDGTNIGGRAGLPSYVQASRLVTQPAFAARNGVLYMAWNNSRGVVYGADSGSDIRYIRSDDDGRSWTTPLMVNPAVPGNTYHVLPALAIDRDPNDVHVMYYTQRADGGVDVDIANSHDRGQTFPYNRTVRVTGASFDLPPTNARLSAPSGGNYNTTNYDRTIRPCYSLGEYLSVTTANGSVYGLWGDARNIVVEPVNPLSPLSGQTHTQQDVFYQKVKAQ